MLPLNLQRTTTVGSGSTMRTERRLASSARFSSGSGSGGG